MFIAIGLGVSLGLVYQSIPEPPPKPIDPTQIPAVIESPLSPLPTPESLAAAIERDVQHLSSSAGEANHLITFADAAQDEYAQWYAALQNAYGRWGYLPYQTLYAILGMGTLPNGVTWVNLGQFRHGGFYRQTRFYRLENDRWVWILPVQSFWSGAATEVLTGTASTIGPITLQHPIVDASVSGPVIDRFAHAYQNLCESLKCPPPSDRSRLWTLGLTLSLTIKPMLRQPVVQELSGTVQIDLPSPRVVGYYEDANALGDPYISMAYATLIYPVARLASGDNARWETDHGGDIFLQAIAFWQQARLRDHIFLLDVFYQPVSLPPSAGILPNGRLGSLRGGYVNQLRGQDLPPLTDLWSWPTDAHFETLDQTAAQEAKAFVIYIEERYGKDGVVRFLNSLGKARSLKGAIEAALPVRFDEFNRQWMKWITGG